MRILFLTRYSIVILSAVATLCHPICVRAEEGPRLLPPLPIDVKSGQPLRGSELWVDLNPEAPATATRFDGVIGLTLSNGTRLQSKHVASYPPSLALEAVWENAGSGAMGFGFIDFKSSLYYYLYHDASTKELILQRGGGGDDNTRELARHPLDQPAQKRGFRLEIYFPKRDLIALRTLVDGVPIGPEVIDRPNAETGSTFQLYVGSSAGAQVRLHSISTIPAVQVSKGGGWFW